MPNVGWAMIVYLHKRFTWYFQDKDIDELDNTCDTEDDEELYLAVDESNDYDGDDVCDLSADDSVEPVDDADDVINELESLLEVLSFLMKLTNCN